MEQKPIIIIGAGLCGSMLAISLARRGYTVELFEKRPDMRKVQISAGRSINLALSDRGLRGLRMVGLEQAALQISIPMRGRMIHDETGRSTFLPYSGRQGEHINSISRGGLNMLLLDQAEQTRQVRLHFQWECQHVDLNTRRARFRHLESGEVRELEGLVILGADGAGSALRQAMLDNSAAIRFNFSLQYLSHGYKELSMPPFADGSHRMEKHALHIWPRGSYMMIALPNLDGSFTVTLFLPYSGPTGFDNLKTDADVQNLFREHFPDALELIPGLEAEFFGNPVGALGTVKCAPWHYQGHSLLLGDAAHAIVPFYGQGMNCAFEDVVVFDEILGAETHPDWDRVFRQTEQARKVNSDAIADLAIDNFYEMRDHVANPLFVRKRKLETRLEQTYPDYFSKYSLVTFQESVPYSEAMRLGRLQDDLLMDYCARHENITESDLPVVKDLLSRLK